MKTTTFSTISCTLTELVYGDEAIREQEYGQGRCGFEHALICAFRGDRENDEFTVGEGITFAAIRKTSYPSLARIYFTSPKLFERFGCLDITHQEGFLMRVCKLLWSEENIVSVDIEVVWSISKTRRIRAEKVCKTGSHWVSVRFSLP